MFSCCLCNTVLARTYRSEPCSPSKCPQELQERSPDLNFNMNKFLVDGHNKVWIAFIPVTRFRFNKIAIRTLLGRTPRARRYNVKHHLEEVRDKWLVTKMRPSIVLFFKFKFHVKTQDNGIVQLIFNKLLLVVYFEAISYDQTSVDTTMIHQVLRHSLVNHKQTQNRTRKMK